MGQGENICLHVGQAGCQLGFNFWELICMEHGIYPDGTLATEFGHTRHDGETAPFFQETMPLKYVPRTIFYDFDPDVVNVLRNGCYRDLFGRENLLSGKEDAANNFARGFYSMGKDYSISTFYDYLTYTLKTEGKVSPEEGQEFIECLMDKFRRHAEATSRIAGIIIMRSTTGGTGGGFGSLLLEQLTEDYGKTTKVSFDINPSAKIATSPVEPYNCVLTCHSALETCHCSFTSDNEQLYEICARHLDLRCPNYQNVNQVLAQTMSAITATFRFPGNLNMDISDLQTNLVPYPRIHFPLMSYAPLIPYEQVYHDRYSVNGLVDSIFLRSNQMLHCDTRKGKFMACTLLFRGDVTPNDVNAVLARLKHNKSKKSRMRFVDWAPTGFKLGMCFQPPISVPGSSIACTCRSVVGMINSTAVAATWQRVLKKFDLMYYRRAFVHWYIGEGMEEDEFAEARENLETLMMDYHEITTASGDQEEPQEYRSHQDIDLT